MEQDETSVILPTMMEKATPLGDVDHQFEVGPAQAWPPHHICDQDGHQTRKAVGYVCQMSRSAGVNELGSCVPTITIAEKLRKG